MYTLSQIFSLAAPKCHTPYSIPRILLSSPPGKKEAVPLASLHCRTEVQNESYWQQVTYLVTYFQEKEPYMLTWFLFQFQVCD